MKVTFAIASKRLSHTRRWVVLLSQHRLALSAISLFFLLALAYTASIDIRATRGASITGDEPFYLLTTQSLLQDGDLDLRQQYERRSYESFFDHPDGLWRQSVPLTDGTVLSPHNPGLSVLLIPGFAVAGLLGAQVQLLLLAALTYALAYVLAVRMAGSLLWSWIATAVVALSASAFIYATEIYPEVPASLAMLAALLLTHGHQRLGAGRALAVVGCLSLMVWLGVKYAPLAAIVSLWALWRADTRGRMALLGVGGASAALFAWFHLRTFGGLTPYTVGAVYAGDSTASIVTQHLAFWQRAYRLWGLFIDERFGVGRWAPVLLPVVPALLLLWRCNQMARVILSLVVAQAFIAVFVAITMMGYWFPGRTLITIFPLLVAPLALLLERLPQWGRLAMGLLSAYSLAVTAALSNAGHRREISIAVDPFDMRSPMFQAVAGAFPNYTYWDAGTWFLTVVWLMAALLAGGYMYFGHRSVEEAAARAPKIPN